MQIERNEVGTKSQNHTTIERKSDHELVITRTFDAPAKKVFDAWTTPELVRRWFAPESTGMQLVGCEIDLRVGGKYRYVYGGAGESTFAFFGTYTHVERPARLVWTDEDVAAGATGEAFSAATFDEKGGKTTVTLSTRFPTKEALDEARASGMEAGTRETFEQLAGLLAALASD